MDISLSIDASRINQALERLAEADLSTGPIGHGLDNAGMIYLGFTRRRFDALSKGGGEWPDLAYSTKLQRARALRGKVDAAHNKLNVMVRKLRKQGKSLAEARRIAAREAREVLKNISIADRITTRRRQFDAKVRNLVKSKKISVAEARRILIASMRFQILRDTGLLFNSLSQGQPGNVFEHTATGIVVGTAVEYAHFHQNPSRPGRPPVRRILVEPDAETQTAMENAIQRGMAQFIRDASHG